MITLRFLISVTALWCLSTATLLLNAQEIPMNDLAIDGWDLIIKNISDTWKPVKDSVYRYSPFNHQIKESNRNFIKELYSLKGYYPGHHVSIDSLNKKFPKPDATIKTDTTIKQYYFVRNKEYCQYKSKKIKLSDNIPYLIILIFDKKDQLLKQVITN